MENWEVIFGPPGTGKTTELSRLVRYYAEDEGSDSLLLCAYTKSAARELAGRNLPLEARQIGTLHSHCYHALDCPTIAESQYSKWNTAFPAYQLSPDTGLRQHDDPQHEVSGPRGRDLLGDTLLKLVDVLRHRVVSQAQWPLEAQAFFARWTDWKRASGYLDFTDLLDRAYVLFPIAPGRPETIIVDEAQDLSLLQWRLLTSWAKHATRLIASGDDDQCLYRWAGADFRPLLQIPHRRTLPRSYRVPARVQAYATRFTDAIGERQPKTWEPRPEPGIYTYDLGKWDMPSRAIALLHERIEDPWGTVACIAPCAYMLEPLVKALRAEGIPFGNRWRRRNRSWNPLAPAPKGVNTFQRLLDFARPLDRLWTWRELATWLPLIRTDGVLIRGAKTHVLLRAEEEGLLTLDALRQLFVPEALAGALSGSLDWLEYQVLQSRAEALAYPLRVYRRHGKEGLAAEPQVIVGTAHSLKGSEADTVIFFKDLSRAQYTSLVEGGGAGDDVNRMLYVAATRARERLILMEGHHGI